MPGFFVESAVEGWLSATGLFGIVIDATAEFLQHLHHIYSNMRVKLVYETGNEYIYYHFT